MTKTQQQFSLTDDQIELQRLARTVANREVLPRALEWEKTGEFPWDNIRVLAETDLLGVTIPEAYGGSGGSWLEGAIVLEELGRCCYTTAMAALGEIGVQTQAIAAYGTEQQKERFLPLVAKGELICAICMTEPDTGSDLASMRTVARDDGDNVVINGEKALISRADVAGLFVVYVRFENGIGDPPIGAILIERDTPGLVVGARYETLGGEGLFEVQFHNCSVPKESVLVRDGGFRKMLTAFNGQRCLNASISIGIAQGAQEAAIAYAKERIQGGRPIGRYQGIGWMLADNAIEIESARLLVHRAAAIAAGGFPSRYETAIAKVHANEMACRVTDRVMQIFGGHGWLKEMPAERYVRWARYGALGGGTPQIQRNGIARHLLGP